MNLFSHITMGRYLYTYFTENLGVELDKGSFVRWNVLPDIAPSLLKLSHFKKDIYDLVMARAEHLSKEGDNMSVEEYSKQLGILCHFMSDLISNAAEIDHSTALYEQINELHEQYSQLAPSYGVDFVFSLTACVDLLMGMLGAKTPAIAAA